MHLILYGPQRQHPLVIHNLEQRYHTLIYYLQKDLFVPCPNSCSLVQNPCHKHCSSQEKKLSTAKDSLSFSFSLKYKTLSSAHIFRNSPSLILKKGISDIASYTTLTNFPIKFNRDTYNKNSTVGYMTNSLLIFIIHEESTSF